MKHQLVRSEVATERGGVVARCECGWMSGGHFSGAGASAAFMDHVEEEQRKETKPNIWLEGGAAAEEARGQD